MNKKMNILIIVVFFFIIFGFGTFSLFSKEKSMSVVENRELAKFPAFSWSNFLSGKYFSQIASYASDQLALRDLLVHDYQSQQQSFLFDPTIFNNSSSAKNQDHTGTKIQSAKVINNEFILVNHQWIFPALTSQFHQSSLNDTSSRVNDIAAVAKSTNTETYLIFNPYKPMALKHLIPSNMLFNEPWKEKNYFISHLSSNVDVIDASKSLDGYTQKQKEEMFFKTDHHWNIKGAFPAYQYAINEMAKKSRLFHGKPLSMNDINVVTPNPEKFNGSLNTQLQNAVDLNEDKPVIYLPKNPFDFSRFQSYSTNNVTSNKFNDYYAYALHNVTSAYTYTNIYADDQQQLFFENSNANNRLKVLMIKDSYANPTLPFYAQQFYQLVAFDNRYMNSFDLKTYLKNNHFDLLIFEFDEYNLYSGSYTFKK